MLLENMLFQVERIAVFSDIRRPFFLVLAGHGNFLSLSRHSMSATLPGSASAGATACRHWR
jgi:hypothetical protein